jgi:hypothetical protein
MVIFIAAYDEGRDQREFVEEIEEEDVHRGEDPEQAAMHDEQQHQVGLQALRLRAQGIEPGR